MSKASLLVTATIAVTLVVISYLLGDYITWPRWEFPSSIDESTAWSMFFTGGLLGVAILQAGFFLWQLRLMKNSVESANKAADAASKTLEMMSDTAQRQLRAYLTIDKARINFHSPCTPTSSVTIKNCGQTPAKHVQTWIHTWIETYPSNSPLPYPTEHDLSTQGNSVVGAGQELLLVDRQDNPLIAETEKHLIGTAQATIYVYGEVSYKDIFGTQQSLTFKLMHGGEEGAIENALKPCSDGNTAS